MLKILLALVATIAIAEVARLALVWWPVSKKSHFKRRLDFVNTKVYDKEFELHKAREEREGTRKEYDFMKARIDTVDTQIKNFPKDGNIDEKKRIEDQKVLAKRELERLEKQLQDYDIMINGKAPSAELPNGIMGIIKEMESLKEAELILKDWIKSI